MKSKTYLAHYIFLISFFASVSTYRVHSQDNKVFELKTESITNGEELPYQLLYGLKPTIYVKNNAIINVTGPNSPVSLNIFDVPSLKILGTDNILFHGVQILKIQLKDLSDLNNYIDISSIRGFDNLSYIYVMCYFKCTENQIRSFLKNANPEIIIYFEHVNPS